MRETKIGISLGVCILLISTLAFGDNFGDFMNEPRKAPGLSKEKQLCSPNDIFIILLYGLGKDSLPLPKSQLIFGEVQDLKIIRIIENEFPLAANKVSTHDFDKIKSTFIQVYYDGFSMAYLIGNDLLSERYWRKLYEISFSLKLKHQKISEQETNIFLKLKDLYGDYTKKEQFRYSTGKRSGVSVYIWEKPNIVIKYRSPYIAAYDETVIVVEYIDKNYAEETQ
jgi:hypothetical protein